MTGAEHYDLAQDCLMAAESQSVLEHAARELGAAQVHATLALAAAIEKQNRLVHGDDNGGYR